VIFERTTILRAPLPRVFEFFGAPENLARITPPATRFRIVAGPARRLREGDPICPSDSSAASPRDGSCGGNWIKFSSIGAGRSHMP